MQAPNNLRSLLVSPAAAIALLLMTQSCAPPQTATVTPDIEPPVAVSKPHQLEAHGHVRSDEYYWLRERESPEVIAHLEAENAYTEAVMEHTEALQDKLYNEIVGRIAKDDTTVPYKERDHFYYSRVEEGGEYRIYCRREGSMDAEEQVILDGNALAEGHEFFALGGLDVSSGQNILVYAVDTVGRRFYTLNFKDLETGETLPDTIPDVTGNVAWAEDGKTLFYGKQHPETLRSYRIYRHVLGTDSADDELVYEETDETFSSYVYKTKSKRYLVIASQQTLSTEARILPADRPNGEFVVFEPRKRDHEYGIDHFDDSFYIATNHEAKNFRLMKTPVGATSMANWTEVIPHREDVLLSGFEIFRDHLVVRERKDGLVQIQIRPWAGGEAHYLDFGEPAYVAYFSDNPDFDTKTVRYLYSSMTTPWSTFDYDMETREKTLRKQDPVLGGYEAGDYVTERLWAPARDGVEVPVSLVYKKGLAKDGSNPLLLYGYGSYGATIDPTFNSARLSLLDRGFVYAIAHIRGGQALGRDWYESGKLLTKMNTFTDFIDAGEHLVTEGYAKPERMYAMGGSAGGLLMGAVVNLRPDLFDGVVSHVPFVDVVTTMLDDDIPLTTGEYDEWGDPNEKTYYDYMLSYSPYDQLEAKDYPHMLITTGLHDSQVQYWEPAKYVARVRALKTDDNRVLLKTNMDAGHGGATGRFKRHRETALDYAFLLDLAGIDS